MKKLALALFAFSFCAGHCDPGVMIDIEIIFERPSGSGEAELG